MYNMPRRPNHSKGTQREAQGDEEASDEAVSDDIRKQSVLFNDNVFAVNKLQ